jgi:hypothetical protein
MTKTPNRQRDKLVQVRVSTAELATIAEGANRVGLTVASYARQQVLGGAPLRAVRRPPVDRVLVAQVLAALGPIATDVRALARCASLSGGQPVEAEKVDGLIATLAELRDLAMKALGRAP